MVSMPMTKMKWIGLTGGIASGKSTVAKLISARGVPVIDADQMARKVSQKGTPGLHQLVQHFGQDILGPDGELDRKRLGEKVFSNKQKLLELEAILHPLIKIEVQKKRAELSSLGAPLAFYDVPLLFEKKMDKDFDYIVLVSTTQNLQIERMKSRDGFSIEQAEARLLNQIPLAEKEAKANWIIHNHGSLKDLEVATDDVLLKIQSEIP